jgi:hypothetical protein
MELSIRWEENHKTAERCSVGTGEEENAVPQQTKQSRTISDKDHPSQDEKARY